MFAVVFTACTTSKKTELQYSPVTISDDSLLTLVEARTFQYFWGGAEPTSGAARERFHADNVYPENDKHVVTSGGTGFGVMAILVGIERGFITRKQGVDRLTHFVTWLEKADRFHGVWPHWWNGETGKVKPFSPNDNGGDLVETSYLLQGLLCVRQYFKDGNEAEKSLASRIDRLWKEVEFDWHRQNRWRLFTTRRTARRPIARRRVTTPLSPSTTASRSWRLPSRTTRRAR